MSEHMSEPYTPDTRRWALASTVQPPDGSGLPEKRTEVVPGRRYSFTVTGTVSTTPGRHVCGNAGLEVTDDSGRVHYLNGNSEELRTEERTKGWPPQTGDTWQDEKGEPWFCRRDPRSRVKEMVSATGNGTLAHTSMVLGWTLAYRPSGMPS